MSTILPNLRFFVKERLRKNLRCCRDARLRTRYLIVLNLSAGRTPRHTAAVLGVHRDTVYRVAKRFREHGTFGLLDRRGGNGAHKLQGGFLDALDRLVRGSPQDHGWRRPTWTRELLVETLVQWGYPRVHVATLSRALRQIRARRGRPRPTVGCPWSPQRKGRRLAQIRQLVAQLPPDEVAVYEDEVDIHLNPRIGYDWMGYGQQKEVLTPGQNEKRYVAGAVNAQTGELLWAESDRKDSWLFVELLAKLYHHYAQAKVIHVILDNYCIHNSKLVAWALQQAGGRIQLHPLPPYCPQHNPIERLWEDLHAEVTRNHTCPDMDDLMACVRVFLLRRYFAFLDRAAEDHQPHSQGS